MLRRRVALAAMLLLPVESVSAQAEGDAYDRIWRFSQWYENDANPAVQSVAFSGRFQYEYASVTDDTTYDEWNVRRFRLGLKSRFFRSITVHVEAEFNPQEADPFYTRLTDTYVEWSRDPSIAVTVGKHSAPFTMDGSTSSKELLTIDRSNLSNNMWFTQEYMPGVSISGQTSGWTYHGGVYSSGDQNEEFGDFSGAAFLLTVIGYDFGAELGVDEALLRANYVFQSEDPANTFTRQLGHVGSVNLKLESGRWGIRSDVSAASGYQAQSDLWGTMLMPYVSVTSGLQLVARHTYVSSQDPNGVRLARYENRHTSGRGDRYHELYAGANYFFYDHKLKLQGGLQFADMNDDAADGGAYSGVSATVALRVSW
jgi:phosphate-selective porin OprO/OprP